MVNIYGFPLLCSIVMLLVTLNDWQNNNGVS